MNRVDLVIPGPEAAIVNGLADRLTEYGIACCAPSAQASQLESSKTFTKHLCQTAGIPTAASTTFDDLDEALKYNKILFESSKAPLVIKADGLAAGKGVIIAKTEEEAEKAIKDILGWRIFGDAGKKILFEEFLEGKEASVFAVCNGTDAVYFGSAQDYKRRYDNDEGPNTGGMGAISPAPAMTDEMLEKTWQTIILPTLEEMKYRGMPYKGILFAGIMIVNNEPMLVEYNVRFGDPECQTLLARMKSDLLDLLYQAATGGSLPDVQMFKKTAVSVVMVAPGYPQAPQMGSIIRAKPMPVWPDVDGELFSHLSWEDLDMFHSGTKLVDNELVAAGGRVLTITETGKTIAKAREYAYEAISEIDWPEGSFRNDIGL